MSSTPVTYETRTIAMLVVPIGDSIFSEQATRIEIDDEAHGSEFVKVTQAGGHTDTSKWLLLYPAEWPAVRAAIDTMIAECREN